MNRFAFSIICVSLCSAFGVRAQTTAAINISNIQYQLVNLDPGDGITPALTWTSSYAQSSVQDSVQTGTTGSSSPSPVFGAPVTSQQSNTSQLYGATQAQVSGNTASTSAAGLSVNVALPSGANIVAYAVQGGYFTLTPQTAVTFSANYSATVTGTAPAGAAEPNGYFDWAYFQTIAQPQIGQWNSTFGPGSQVFGAPTSSEAYIRSGPGNDNQTASNSGPISETISNASSTELATNVGFVASVNAYTVQPLEAVPEPQTWLFLSLGGLVFLPRRLGKLRR